MASGSYQLDCFEMPQFQLNQRRNYRNFGLGNPKLEYDGIPGETHCYINGRKSQKSADGCLSLFVSTTWHTISRKNWRFIGNITRSHIMCLSTWCLSPQFCWPHCFWPVISGSRRRHWRRFRRFLRFCTRTLILEFFQHSVTGCFIWVWIGNSDLCHYQYWFFPQSSFHRWCFLPKPITSIPGRLLYGLLHGLRNSLAMDIMRSGRLLCLIIWCRHWSWPRFLFCLKFPTWWIIDGRFLTRLM